MKPREGLWGRLVLENWGLKLFSFAFAILLWMFVVGEKRSEMSVAIPLELTGVPPGIVIVNRVPEVVRVRLSGPRTVLAGINPQQLSVALSVAGIQPGTTTFENLASRIGLPKRIEVTYISPSAISLEADLKVRKVLHVRPRVKGEPMEGFEVEEVRIEPAEVEVEGAETVLKRLAEVPAEVVDLTGLAGSATRPVELSLPDPSLRRVSTETLRLQVVLKEVKGQRQFLQVPVTVPDATWVATPAAVDIKVEGGTRRLSLLREQDFLVHVDVSGRRLPRGPVPVLVRTPAGVRLVSVSPKMIEVRVRRGAAPADREAPDVPDPSLPGG